MNETRMGWLLESSADGLAFAWRGDHPPAANALIDVCMDTDETPDAWERSVVRHVASVHDNLCVIGVERVNFRDFPPAPAMMVTPPSAPAKGAELAIPLLVELHPRPGVCDWAGLEVTKQYRSRLAALVGGRVNIVLPA